MCLQRPFLTQRKDKEQSFPFVLPQESLGMHYLGHSSDSREDPGTRWMVVTTISMLVCIPVNLLHLCLGLLRTPVFGFVYNAKYKSTWFYRSCFLYDICGATGLWFC